MKNYKDYYRERYLKNKEAILAKHRERYKDPEVRAKKRAYDKKRIAEKKAAGLGNFSLAKREMHYRQRYGINIEQYDKMLQEQEGCCKICKIPHTSLRKRMAVDHCHSTGKVRGLLCDSCNKGLGHFKDDLELLSKAIDYLSNTKP
jgi:hypothetical protein